MTLSIRFKSALISAAICLLVLLIFEYFTVQQWEHLNLAITHVIGSLVIMILFEYWFDLHTPLKRIGILMVIYLTFSTARLYLLSYLHHEMDIMLMHLRVVIRIMTILLYFAISELLRKDLSNQALA